MFAKVPRGVSWFSKETAIESQVEAVRVRDLRIDRGALRSRRNPAEMADQSHPGRFWLLCLMGIILLGILSRLVHTGFLILDKYLGDALYAAMVYVILRLRWKTARVAVPAMLLMTAVELFQLTMIPARMLESSHLIVRICARLMGTEFSFLDLLAYATGIASIYLIDSGKGARASSP
jgi:hypothetical protein